MALDPVTAVAGTVGDVVVLGGKIQDEKNTQGELNAAAAARTQARAAALDALITLAETGDQSALKALRILIA